MVIRQGRNFFQIKLSKIIIINLHYHFYTLMIDELNSNLSKIKHKEIGTT